MIIAVGEDQQTQYWLLLDVVVVDDMMMIITIKDLFRCPRPKNRNQSTADAIPIVAVELQ